MPTASPNARSSLVWLLVACCFLLAPPALAGEARHVLVLYSNNRLLPANLEFEAGLRETLVNSAESSAEFLDYPRFDGESYIRALTLFLNEKYARLPPDVLVAAGEESLDFLLRHRAELFPRIPMVYAAVARSFLSSLPPLPADVVGVPIQYDFPGTIALALRWHPQARRLVVVTGSSAQDRAWEVALRGEVARFQDRVTAEFLAGLSTSAVLNRLGALGGGAGVYARLFRGRRGPSVRPARSRRAHGRRRRRRAGVRAVRHLHRHGHRRRLHAEFRGHGTAGGRDRERSTRRRRARRTALAKDHAPDRER